MVDSLLGYACQPRPPGWRAGSNGKIKLVDTLSKLNGSASMLSMPVGKSLKLGANCTSTDAAPHRDPGSHIVVKVTKVLQIHYY